MPSNAFHLLFNCHSFTRGLPNNKAQTVDKVTELPAFGAIHPYNLLTFLKQTLLVDANFIELSMHQLLARIADESYPEYAMSPSPEPLNFCPDLRDLSGRINLLIGEEVFCRTVIRHEQWRINTVSKRKLYATQVPTEMLP